MNSLDSQIEELIKERNAFEAENIALKAQVNQLREALTMSFNGAWDDDHATTIDKIVRAAMDNSSEQCLNSVCVQAIRDLARTECPVSGPIITNEESRKQMLEWADFEERCNNER